MRRVLIAGALIAVIAYGVGITSGPVYEDGRMLGLAGSWTWAWLWTVRGLQLASLWFTNQMGLGVTGAHIAQLALHVLNGWLVWRILRSLHVPEMAAVVAPIIVWTHPIMSEGVAYLSGRGDVMVATAALTAILWLVKDGPMSGARMIGVGACAVTGMMTKETGIVVVPIALWTLVCWWPLRRIGWAAWTAMAGVALVLLLLLPDGSRVFHLAETYHRAALSGYPPLHYAAIQASAFWRDVTLIVWPSGFTIEPDIEAIADAWHILALAALVVTGYLAWRGRHHVAGWAVGVALISVLPRFLIRQEEFLHEHHMYLAVACLSMALASGVARWHRGQEPSHA